MSSIALALLELLDLGADLRERALGRFEPRIVGCWPGRRMEPRRAPSSIRAESSALVEAGLLGSHAGGEGGAGTLLQQHPSRMACFLRLLQVEEGSTVLAFGTRASHRAALLCKRLGPRASPAST
jgi:hypothetical protein